MPAVPYARLESELLALYKPPHRRKATWNKMRQALREFGAMPGVRTTADLTPTLIVRWIEAHADRKPVSNQSVLRSFRAACGYAVTMGYLCVSPWSFRKDWVRLEDDADDTPPAPKHRSIAEIAGILALLKVEAADGGWEEGRLYALVAVYAYTGLRKMEALGLKVKDIDLGARLIEVRSRKKRRLKNASSAGKVGIPAELARILKPWLKRCGSEWAFPTKCGKSPWTGGEPGKKPLDRVKAAAARAGVPGMTIHGFRHSIATHCSRWGLGPLAVKELLRHTSLATQEHYLGEDLANIRETARRIRYKVA